jgi:hypothetical protein
MSRTLGSEISTVRSWRCRGSLNPRWRGLLIGGADDPRVGGVEDRESELPRSRRFEVSKASHRGCQRPAVRGVEVYQSQKCFRSSERWCRWFGGPMPRGSTVGGVRVFTSAREPTGSRRWRPRFRGLKCERSSDWKHRDSRGGRGYGRDFGSIESTWMLGFRRLDVSTVFAGGVESFGA